MKPLILFGCGKIAEVVLYFLRDHSERRVVACCADRPFLPEEPWNGLPTVAFDEVEARYPPQTHDMFVALGYQSMNALRQMRCEQARQLGYQLASYVHPQSGLPNDCAYGDNCFFMNQVLVHPRVVIGSNVFVWSGAMIGHHSRIGNNCWLTSGASIAGGVEVGDNVFFAIGSTVCNSLSIGRNCFIGANALVSRNTQEGEVLLAESSKPIRLNSQQFLRMSRFNDL
ncbi:MAG: acetyltransferase [Burkholderiaceae bacterium]|nr:acetyltransferase [Burkholderiaceae bacterium]